MNQGTRGRFNRDIGRRDANREKARTFLIVVEGEKTERIYFETLCRVLGLKSVEVHHPECTDPIGLVEVAVARAEARAASATQDAFDEVWIVFDRESQHGDRIKQIQPARQLAADRKHRVALSIPCFELWLVLHFQPRPGALDTKARAERLLKDEHLPDYDGKTLPGELFTAEKLRYAVQNAEECSKYHDLPGSKGDPSSEVHLLIRALNAAAAPTARLL